MPGASLALFADLGACHVQKSSVTICVLPTPSGWRATRCRHRRPASCPDFYPRPPGGGRRGRRNRKRKRWCYFYPRPPGGGRPGDAISAVKARQFLSTPSEWRATPARQGGARANEDFYPRPPGGGRLRRRGLKYVAVPISIHALRVEGDQGARHFYCTVHISIHALRVEGDLTQVVAFVNDFLAFLSTPSGWRATSSG